MNGYSRAFIRFFTIMSLFVLAGVFFSQASNAETFNAFLKRLEGKTWKGVAERNYYGYYYITCQNGVLSAYGYRDGKLEACWSKKPQGRKFVVGEKDYPAEYLDYYFDDKLDIRTYEISADGKQITESFPASGPRRNNYFLQ